jgi:flavin-dependent dehydrogenase
MGLISPADLARHHHRASRAVHSDRWRRLLGHPAGSSCCLLQQRARAAGVICAFDRIVHAVYELQGYDVIVAADGVNSLVRRSFEAEFQSSQSHLANKFVWYGTCKPFETLTQTIERQTGQIKSITTAMRLP